MSRYMSLFFSIAGKLVKKADFVWHASWTLGLLTVSISTETAQSALGSDVNEAVITVPFEFGPAQKRALR